uniref:Phosphoinositide phospholipase C n=1 Tax=Kalanchoe fedtschenkoi TaxID=63787 RepID=A0A7N0T3I7_KALFE
MSSSSSKQSFRVCLCFSRKFKLTVAEAPPEIKSLFNQYADPASGIMTPDGLLDFLVRVQGEVGATKEDAEAIVDSFKHIKHVFPTSRTRGLTFDSFFRFLFGDQNAPLLQKVHHHMDAPLSHYFIYTGHNSYLTGNQVSSLCSDVPIIKALLKGVRVIELDMWPNSAKDDIDILHGRTLTTPVGLTKCLKSIKEYAFVKSEYPVILTLEDHLTPELQAKVAELVVEIFGDTLYTCYAESPDKFPSPESLKRRIIISTKPPKEYLKSSSGNASKDKDGESLLKGNKDSSDDDSWGKELPDLEEKLLDQQPDKIYPEDVEDDDIAYQDDGCTKIQQSVALAYKNLIAIHARGRKGGLKEWFRLETDKVRRLSLREHVLEKAVLTHGKEIIRFTQDNLLRIFPKGSRLDSSNYNPLIGWIHGAQMVAFNMQGHGRSLWLMQGLFRGNGGCGYVKKPDLLLKKEPDDEIFDPRLTLPIKTTLKVKVYMGEGWYMDFRHTHFDTYSPPDFYTRVGIAGVPEDCVMKKTKIMEDEWSPVWDEEFEFKLTVPELALLRIEVHEYDVSGKDDFGGQTCLPVSELCTGIRAVPLHDRKGDKYNCVKLLMRFTFA